MKRVSSVVSVGEDKRLLALALGPPVHKQWRVPVDFVEDVRNVDVALRAVVLLTSRPYMGGPRHVILVVIEGDIGVVARWEMNIGTERGGVAVAVHVRKACPSTFVAGILHPDAVHAVRVGGIGGDVVV
jgi:hypothetical protein